MIQRDKLSTRMPYVYVLENKEGRYYIGSCGNIEQRLKKHNQNSVRSTKHEGPFRIIYQEKLATVTEARRRENQLKSYKGGIRFRKLLDQN